MDFQNFYFHFIQSSPYILHFIAPSGPFGRLAFHFSHDSQTYLVVLLHKV